LQKEEAKAKSAKRGMWVQGSKFVRYAAHFVLSSHSGVMVPVVLPIIRSSLRRKYHSAAPAIMY